MHRRGFVASVLCAIGELLTVSKEKKPEQESYWYDWLMNPPNEKGRWTNDPKFKDVYAPYGTPKTQGLNYIWLDGKEVCDDLYIVRIQTGEYGWIEAQVIENGRRVYIEDDGVAWPSGPVIGKAYDTTTLKNIKYVTKSPGQALLFRLYGNVKYSLDGVS